MVAKHITKRVVDSLSPGEIVFDTTVKGFTVRCQRKRKIYGLKVRIGARQRWFTIGEHGSPWTADSARQEAQRLWGDIRSGVNLTAIREARREQPLVSELCDRFLSEHAAHHKKPSSIRMDEANIANYVKPRLGSFTISDITRDDIDRFKRAVRDGTIVPRIVKSRGRGSIMTGGPGVANRCMALLSKMFNLAEVWGWRAEHTNPCRGVVRYRENKRQRFLSNAEVERLGEALSNVEASRLVSPFVVAAIRLLLLTGARAGEILSLRWSEVDLERGLLLLPDSKTGQKTIYLNGAASDILKRLPRVPGSTFVIVGAKPGAVFTNIHKPWRQILRLAEIEDFRVHDLRHSFASTAAANGASLLVIGKLLGHTNPLTTQRYAHLLADPLREYSETVGTRITALLIKTVTGAPAERASFRRFTTIRRRGALIRSPELNTQTSMRKPEPQAKR